MSDEGFDFSDADTARSCGAVSIGASATFTWPGRWALRSPSRLFELGFIERLAANRSVAITTKGREVLRRELGVALEH